MTTARCRCSWDRQPSDRGWRRRSPRSPPMRSNCLWSRSAASITAPPTISPKATAPMDRARWSWGDRRSSMRRRSCATPFAKPRPAGSAATSQAVTVAEGKALAPDGRALTFAEIGAEKLKRRRHLCERQADLQLRHPCGACRGGPQDRPRPSAGVRFGRRRRTHHQSGNGPCPDRGRDRAGAGWRFAGTPQI